MVVPLKLTQFYGHQVPRPWIYPDVKFSVGRVDPPPSVNDALLSWASDAHWSMGGLSFKRLRMQGKVEGSLRRLRALLDDGEGEDEAKIDGVKAKIASLKEVSGPVAKKRQPAVEESDEAATPVRKSKRKMADTEESNGASPLFVPATADTQVRRSKRKIADAEEDDGGSPLFVPATVEKQRKLLRSKDAASCLVPATEKQRVTRRGHSPLLKKVVKSPVRKVHSLSFETPVTESKARKSKVTSDDHGSEPAKSPELGHGKRLSRSAMKASPEALPASSPPSQPPFKQHTARPKKLVLRNSDESSSESDDGLEAFLKQKGCPLRRSSRMVKQSKSLPLPSGSEADSD